MSLLGGDHHRDRVAQLSQHAADAAVDVRRCYEDDLLVGVAAPLVDLRTSTSSDVASCRLPVPQIGFTEDFVVAVLNFVKHFPAFQFVLQEAIDLSHLSGDATETPHITGESRVEFRKQSCQGLPVSKILYVRAAGEALDLVERRLFEGPRPSDLLGEIGGELFCRFVKLFWEATERGDRWRRERRFVLSRFHGQQLHQAVLRASGWHHDQVLRQIERRSHRGRGLEAHLKQVLRGAVQWWSLQP